MMTTTEKKKYILKRNERDELRENVFELIDDTVLNKIKEIKNMLQNQ